MTEKTLKALVEMVRAAVKQVTGREPDGPVTITVCREPRGERWQKKLKRRPA